MSIFRRLYEVSWIRRLILTVLSHCILYTGKVVSDVNGKQYEPLPSFVASSCLSRNHDQCESSSSFYSIHSLKKRTLPQFLYPPLFSIQDIEYEWTFFSCYRYKKFYRIILVHNWTLIFRSFNMDKFVQCSVQS